MKIGLISIFEDKSAPPLGLCYLGTFLEKNGYNVKIIDKNWEDVETSTRKYRPDIIGISSMTHYYGEAIKLAKKFKEKSNIPIFIGGPHISTLPESFNKIFDLGVIGEGELTLLEVLRLYKKNERIEADKLKRIKGLVYQKGNKIIRTPMREPIKLLDSIPIPNRKLLNKNYFNKIWVHWDETMGREGAMLTSRGCPYKCVFCSTSRFWNIVRLNSPEYVLKDLKDLVDNYKVDHVHIWDDLFTISKSRLEKIYYALKKEGLIDKVVFQCQPRANLMDDELCKVMKQLSVRTISFGFESGSERMLKYLKGGSVTVEDNKRTVLLAKKWGFRLYGSLIFGSPSETVKDMRKTIEFIDFVNENSDKAALWHFIMTPFPGTPIWEIAKKRKKVSKDMDWRLLRHQNIDNPLLLDPGIDKKEFQQIFGEADTKLRQLYLAHNYTLSRRLSSPSQVLSIILHKPKHAIKSAKMLSEIFLRRIINKDNK